MQNLNDHSPLTAAAVQAALNGGEILRRGFGTKFTVSSKKSINDLVTDYDRYTEEAIISYLKNCFPSHSFLAEESGRSENINGNICWIIDPLDGTMNFAHHIPIFCISIAAIVEGEIEVGVVYNPLLDELFVAERGHGAFLNGKQIYVSPLTDIQTAILATGFPYEDGIEREISINQFTKFLENGNPVRLIGSAVLNLAYVAAGRLDIYWASNLKPWDVAAGYLLINEAGGRVTHFNGSPHDMFQISNTLATNAHLHEHALSILR